MPLNYRRAAKALTIEFSPLPPIFLEDVYMLDFKDPKTGQYGRVSFRRENPELLTVSFTDLGPGVEPHKAVADPVKAENILAIVLYTIAWLKALKPITYPGGFEAAQPLNFDGLPVLEKLAEQLKSELL